MYSKIMSKALFLSLSIARYFGGSAMMFNPKTEQLTIEKSTVAKVNKNFKLASIWFALALVIVFKRYQNQENLDEFHLSVAWWIGLMLALMVFSMSTFYAPEFCDTGNGTTNTLRTIHASYMTKFDTSKAGGKFLVLDIILVLFYIECILLYILVMLYLFYDPQAVIFLGRLIPSKYYSYSVALPIIFFHTYILGSLSCSIAAIGGPIIMYAFYMYLMINQEMCLERRRYISDNEFRNSANIRIFYRAFQIIHQQAMINNFLGFYILIANVIFMATAVYLTFVLIRYWLELQLISKAPLVIGYILVLGYWTLVLEIGCMFYVGGSKTLGSWKRHNWGFQEQNRLMRKFHRSCTLILLSYGKQFVIGRLSVLTYYKRIERGTYRALLMLK